MKSFRAWSARARSTERPWVQIGGNEAMLARLALPETRARIEAEIADHGLNNWGRIPSWEAVQISISPKLPQRIDRYLRVPTTDSGERTPPRITPIRPGSRFRALAENFSQMQNEFLVIYRFLRGNYRAPSWRVFSSITR